MILFRRQVLRQIQLERNQLASENSKLKRQLVATSNVRRTRDGGDSDEDSDASEAESSDDDEETRLRDIKTFGQRFLLQHQFWFRKDKATFGEEIDENYSMYVQFRFESTWSKTQAQLHKLLDVIPIKYHEERKRSVLPAQVCVLCL